MNEYIEISLRRNNKRLPIKRQVPGGIELDESDPIERHVTIGFAAADDITGYRLARVRQIQGWDPGQFKLTITVEDGSIVLRGVDRFALPEGRYTLTMTIEGATTRTVRRRVTLPYDGFAAVQVEVKTDDRSIAADLTACDGDIRRILDASTIEGQAGAEFVSDNDWRPARRACLLNLLASLRVRPALRHNLVGHIREVFVVFPDRIYARVSRGLFDRVMELVLDPKKPFYREGRPTSPTHLRLIERLPEPPERRALFPPEALVSFRGEGAPSLQMVILEPPAGCDYTYADLDLDLGNPLQDVAGFVVHMGELLSGRVTDHLDLRARLARGPAKPFLYYSIS